MRPDIFLIVSSIVLTIIGKGDTIETIVNEHPETKIELRNIFILPEAEEKFKDFELLGISLQMPDSVAYYEPIYYTPEAGVRVSTDKCFSFPLHGRNDLQGAIFSVTGRYKGKVIHSPVPVNEVIDYFNSGDSYALSIELRNISEKVLDVDITSM